MGMPTRRFVAFPTPFTVHFFIPYLFFASSDRRFLFVKKNDVLYSPDQKYNAMLERNPAIAGLRKLFPNIDY